MAAKPDLWMPLYFGAYLSDTMHLTTEQHGAYLLLLMACWKRGGCLPDDDSQLAAIARMSPLQWRKSKPVISPFWQITSKGWLQKRLCSELESARQRHVIALENGAKGGRPRKPEDNQTINQNETKTITELKPKPNPEESSVPRPLPTPIQGPEPRSTPSAASNPLNGFAVSLIPLAGADDFEVSKEYLSELEAAYPQVDGPATLKEIRAWCVSNPGRCKTKRGVKRFINGWFAKEQRGG